MIFFLLVGLLASLLLFFGLINVMVEHGGYETLEPLWMWSLVSVDVEQTNRDKLQLPFFEIISNLWLVAWELCWDCFTAKNHHQQVISVCIKVPKSSKKSTKICQCSVLIKVNVLIFQFSGKKWKKKLREVVGFEAKMLKLAVRST